MVNSSLLFGYFPKLVGTLVIALTPVLHFTFVAEFLPRYQKTAKELKDEKCTCACWDMVFKGGYERAPPGAYKNFYFNATPATAQIWFLTAVVAAVSYETFRHLTKLAMSSKLRYSMLYLFSTAIFAHYYGWWMYVNYLNDGYYGQWYHQLVYTVTELLSTVTVIRLADTSSEVTGQKVMIVTSVATFHIFGSSLDQFIVNVLHGRGTGVQIARDLFFMIPDWLHLVMPLLLLRRSCQEEGVPMNQKLTKKLVLKGISFSLICTAFVKLIL